MSARFAAALAVHPAQPAGPLRSLAASGSLGAGGRVELDFDLYGNLRQLRLPEPARQPLRRDELWRHSCFECFAARPGQQGYLELNFSASGDWAAYRFAHYRGTRSDLAAIAVNVSSTSLGPEHLRVSARASLAADFGADFGATCQLNIAAVIEDIAGRLSYWAAHHPRSRPDFHDRDGFRVVPRITGTQDT